MLQGKRDIIQGFAERLRLLQYGGRLSLALEHGLPLRSLGTVDLALHFTLGVQDGRPLQPLTLRLQLHTPLNLIWRLNILNLVPEAVYAPLVTRLIQRRLNIGIQTAPLLKCPIQIELANL